MDNILKQAYEFYKNGDRNQAVTILSTLVQKEPNNEKAWYALGVCVEETQKKMYCFKKTLSIDPNHQNAQLAIEKLTSQATPNFQTTPTTEISSESNGKKKSQLVKELASTEIAINNLTEKLLELEKSREGIQKFPKVVFILFAAGLVLSPLGIGLAILPVAVIALIAMPFVMMIQTPKIEKEISQKKAQLKNVRKKNIELKTELTYTNQ
jgi:hypothetical protein